MVKKNLVAVKMANNNSSTAQQLDSLFKAKNLRQFNTGLLLKIATYMTLLIHFIS